MTAGSTRTGPDAIPQALSGAFLAAYGGRPEGVWSAPGRVNLVGEHTDYNAGLCLPIALPHRTYAAARRRDDRLLRLRSLQRDETVSVPLEAVAAGRPGGWGAYPAGVLWALERAGHRVGGGLDILVDGRVPLGAGLSSSAALECAVGVAASDLFGLGLLGSDAALAQLAAACVDAENVIAQAPTGGMDQSAALRCRAGQALLLDCRDGSVEHVPFDLAGHGLALLVVDTRAAHALGDGQYAQRRRSCELAAHTLGVSSLREVTVAKLAASLSRLPDPVTRARVRHVVTEIERVRRTVALLRDGQVERVGPVFEQSHASMRDDFEISCAELDLAVDVTRAAGALGARMTGGGFGGSAIALVPGGGVPAISAAVGAAFAERGWTAPDCFPVTAGAAARREC